MRYPRPSLCQLSCVAATERLRPPRVCPALGTLRGPLPPEELQRRLRAAKKAYGVHAERYVRVYANPVAVTTLLDPTAKQFSPGAIIAKEKLNTPSDDVPEGVAFMIKHAAGRFP